MQGGLGTLTAILGSLGGLAVLAAIYASVRVWFRRTLGSRRDETGKLNRLACGVTVDYVDSLFGPPPFRFSGPVDKAAQAPGVTLLSERIYRLKHAWLRVTAGFDGSVRAFSITVTDPRFRFRHRAPDVRYARCPPRRDTVRCPGPRA